MSKLKRSSVIAFVMFVALAHSGLASSRPGVKSDAPTWRPAASEKLIKLPANYLKKSLDHDFAKSDLANAIASIKTEIGLKGRTLSDLGSAIERSDGELNVELRHQLLTQKREFIQMMQRKSELRERHLRTRQKVLESLLKKADLAAPDMTPVRARLAAAQKGARERFRSSVTKTDLSMLSAPTVPESKYARQYASNLAAVEKLVAAIDRHPMNAQPSMGGKPASKQDFVRQMLADNQAGLAILSQEKNILGFMAKLVALDAMALSEQVMDADLVDSDIPRTSGPADAVRFFVN